jgi:hypothetical protein
MGNNRLITETDPANPASTIPQIRPLPRARRQHGTLRRFDYPVRVIQRFPV